MSVRAGPRYVQVIPCFGITAVVAHTREIEGGTQTSYDMYPIVAWGVTKDGDLEPIALGGQGPGALPRGPTEYRYARFQ